MSEFQFAKSQRVIIPTHLALGEGVQGVVTGNAVHLGREPRYELQWLAAGHVGEKGQLLVLNGSVSESELITAQPPKMVTADAAEALAAEARNAVAAELNVEFNGMAAQIARLEAAAKRRRKASRYRKRR